jgi:hypothetical protein
MSFLTDEIVAASSGNFVVGDDLTVNGNATITLNTVIDDNLTVTNGLVTFSGTGLNVTNGNVVIDDNVTVTNGTVFAGSNVNVTGNVHASNFKAGATTIGSLAISATVGSFGIYGGAAQNISAFPGGGQASATNQGNTMDVTVNVCAADYDSIKLMTTGTTSGYRITVRNATSKICRVYPQVGGSIDGVGYYDLMPGEIQVFRSGITANAFVSVLNTLQKNVSALGTITHTGTGYGFVHDTGLWEDLTFPAQSINPVGPTAGADVDQNTGFLRFDANSVEEICGVAQMPHGWKSGTNVVCHIHSMSDSATDPATDPVDSDTDGACSDHTGPAYLMTATGLGTAAPAGRYVTITGGTNANVNAHLVSSVVNADAVNLTSDPTNGGDSTDLAWSVYKDVVQWRFDYKICGAGSVNWDQSTYSNAISVQRFSVHDGGNATMQLHDLTTLDMTGFQDSALVIWRLARVATNAEQDTYLGDAWLASIDFHHKRNTLGSLAEDGENY